MRKLSFSKVVMVHGHFEQSITRVWELRHGQVLVWVRHSMSKKVAKGGSLVWVWNGAGAPTSKAVIQSWAPILAGEVNAG